MFVFRAIDNLHAISNSCKKIYVPIIFPLNHYRVLYLKNVFYSKPKSIDFRFFSVVYHCDVRPIGSGRSGTKGRYVFYWGWVKPGYFRNFLRKKS